MHIVNALVSQFVVLADVRHGFDGLEIQSVLLSLSLVKYGFSYQVRHSLLITST